MIHASDCECRVCREDRYYDGLGELPEKCPVVPAGRLGKPVPPKTSGNEDE
jgi:hypothetical protein